MTADAVGGVWTYSIDLARALCSRGANVLLVTFGPRPSKSQKREGQTIRRLELLESDYPLEWAADASEHAIKAGGNWLRRVARTFAPDVIHLNGYRYAALPWQTPTVVVAHSDVYSWWEAVDGAPPPAEWQRYHHRVAAGLIATDAIVAPSRAMLAALSRHYSISKQKSEVIHNFSCLQPVRARKRNLVFGAGRLWDRSKNFSILNDVAERCAWPIYLAGSTQGTEPSRFNRLVLAGELSRQQMAEALGSASIFVHPSLYEPFGLSVLEAAKSRCALVLSDIPSLRELWSNAALFANPYDSGDWTEKIKSLIADKSLRREYARRAIARAAHYSMEKCISAYVDLYLDLISGARSKRRVS
ncbi:MAG TPA: glycosyltransferase family 4 protein [Bryobacteraceae bacterium]